MIIRLISICLAAFLLSDCAIAQSEAPTGRKVTFTLASTSTEANKDLGIQHQGVDSNTGRQAPSILSVLSVEPTTAHKTRRRHINYSEDQIIVIGLAADSKELTRTVMIDPRLIRVEAIFAGDDLPSGKLYRSSVDFSISVEDPDVVAMQILVPRWDGNEWHFDIIAESPLQ